jgi:Zn-dependent peptidase ImmA (M78 family)
MVSLAAERAAQLLLDAHGITEPPTPLSRLALAEGVQIVHEPFRGDEVSGMLLREPHRTVIIVNSDNARTRQRFTIAHELGHLKLHKGDMYVDGRARVNFRDGLSSMATDREEIGANAFAAALLMPAPWVRKAYENVVRNTRVQSEQNLAELLSHNFGVSSQAMLLRLVNLGLVAAP